MATKIDTLALLGSLQKTNAMILGIHHPYFGCTVMFFPE
jgi:hypothetical protein